MKPFETGEILPPITMNPLNGTALYTKLWQLHSEFWINLT
jgi:hypothetical protein